MQHINQPSPNSVAKYRFAPTPVTVVILLDHGSPPSTRLIAGHLTLVDQRHYVDGLELAPIGTVVTFEFHQLYADLGDLLPGSFVWSKYDDGWYGMSTLDD